MEKDYDLYRYQASWRAWCAEERQWRVSDELVEKKFEGSLPAFIAAFTKHQAMSEDELDEVQPAFWVIIAVIICVGVRPAS